MKHVQKSAGVILALCLVGITGCSTVTIRDKGISRISGEPTYESSESFYLWGLAGTAHVNVSQICGQREPRQLQAQTTFVDGLLGALTLGIYYPRSVKVWCEAKASTPAEAPVKAPAKAQTKKKGRG